MYLPIADSKAFFKNVGIEFDFNNGFLKGQLYSCLEDFIVEELHASGLVCSIEKENLTPNFTSSSNYVHATLVKKNLSTFDAVFEFAQKNGLDYKTEVSFCGLKDTNGFTSQRICFINKKLSQTVFDNFFLKDFANSEEKLTVNSHSGNKFTVRARKVSESKENIDILNKFKELLIKGLPNFYGPQRFGVRQNNHLYGKLLLTGKYEEFLKEFLIYSNNELKEIKEIRILLKENFGNWAKCLELVKNNSLLNDEEELIKNLLNEADLGRAISNMKLSNFFVHAYSSYLFNLVLSKNLDKKLDEVSFEKIGNGSTNLDESNRAMFDEILKKEGLNFGNFNQKGSLFELKNHSRKAVFYPKNFSYKFDSDELIVSFELGNGEYASLVLGFLFENAFGKLN